MIFLSVIVSCGSYSEVTSGKRSNPPAEFDHSHVIWNEILKEHVLVDGGLSWVDYAGLSQKPEAFDGYLQQLSSISQDAYREWNRNQKLAFLINAYNAFTLKLIVDNYPVESIRDLGGFLTTPWKKKFFILLGEKRHLDDIEHGMIREDFEEPRIHFAVNCASVGCPPLRTEAYVSARLDEQLEENTRAFLQDERRNRYDAGSETLYLSSIFDWYESDFEQGAASVYSFVSDRMNLSEEVKRKVESREVTLRYLDYDWSLNDLAAKHAQP